MRSILSDKADNFGKTYFKIDLYPATTCLMQIKPLGILTLVADNKHQVELSRLGQHRKHDD
ncbi:hypothetical protein NIES4074_09470 [Cylindrospermum sp. NIES-4074]|nr:hypothetical protein NIES4074_09470 [Cylindrospermum sp. NIES-4074]